MFYQQLNGFVIKFRNEEKQTMNLTDAFSEWLFVASDEKLLVVLESHERFFQMDKVVLQGAGDGARVLGLALLLQRELLRRVRRVHERERLRGRRRGAHRAATRVERAARVPVGRRAVAARVNVRRRCQRAVLDVVRVESGERCGGEER